jgi:hypothetical protein
VAADTRRRDEHVALVLDLLGQARVDPLEHRLVVDAGRVAAERDDAERGRRHQLELRRGLDRLPRVVREVQARIDRLTERAGAEVAQRHPELDRA